MSTIIPQEAIKKRNLWVRKIAEIKGSFASNSELVEQELAKEFKAKGNSALINHLRLCGNIPESYGHDTSEEKQYAKYTDLLLSFAYKSVGIKSLVIGKRADAADVEGYGNKFSFVADAKAFRLSRTAKNQKDFKIQAMDRWKHGKVYAMVVCPIYQLPSKNSQIYQQAITRNVCIFTYSHLYLLVRYAAKIGQNNAEALLYKIFKIVPALNPSKSAVDYWLGINKTILSHSKIMFDLWQEEKAAAAESIKIGKEEALSYLSYEREKIMRMSHEDALKELLKANKIDRKMETVKQISNNRLFEIK